MKRKIFVSIMIFLLCAFSTIGLSACGKIEITPNYVIECLKKIPNVVDIEAATEYNDPIGLLNKKGGYIANIYFSVDVINQDEITGITLVDKGTAAGGSIEIYKKAKDAEKRNSYLSSFDGTVLSPGSHTVYDVCVIRTSNELTASQQNILEDNIIKALSQSSDSYVNMDTYLIQVASEIAKKDNFSAEETIAKLEEFGYPLKKVLQIIDDSKIDWKKMAKQRAEIYSNYYATVYPVMIADLLSENGFLEEEILYALENANIDWKYYAKIHAKALVISYEGNYLCPNDILSHLSFDKGYDVPDCEAALASCDVNWNNKAVEYIEYIDSEGEYATKSMYIDELLSVEFTNAQAKYAVDNCGKNWNNKALDNLDYFVNTLSVTPPNRTQCITQLKNWGFYDNEIVYALDHFDGIIYPDKLNYTVDLNPNEGELAVNTLNVIYGKSVTLPIPTRSGYSFVGWYNGETKVESGVWNIAENIRLTAKWTANKYNLSFDGNGGTSPTSITVTYGNAYGSLPTSTRSGYSFAGWFTQKTGGDKIEHTSIVSMANNQTLHAHWFSDIEYTLIGTSYQVTGLTNTTKKDVVILDNYNSKPVTSIKSSAFANCHSVESITIPSSITSVGTDAFYWCYKLEKVYISDLDAWCNIDFKNYASNPLNLANSLYLNGKLVTELQIPKSVTVIKDYAFIGFSGTKITVHNDIIEIGAWAFYNCSSLTSIEIPDGVTSIGSSAFEGCSGLTSIAIPSSVTSIGYYAFYNCSSLASIVILEGVTSIGNFAFYDCSGLTSIVIPSSVTSISYYAFKGCSGLTRVTFKILTAGTFLLLLRRRAART